MASLTASTPRSSLSAAWPLVFAAIVSTAVLAGGAWAQQTILEDFWTTDGPVRDIVVSGNTAYLGGSFTYVAPLRWGGALLDPGTGGAVSGFPRINTNSVVHAVASDGQGGWYIGGDFQMVGGLARSKLAHIAADMTVTAWDPMPTLSGGNPVVWSLAVAGNTVYIGGAFSHVGGQPHRGVAAVDAVTGAVSTWNPNLQNGAVYALAVDGNTVYLGGTFTSFCCGQTRNRMAAVDATTGLLTGFDPNASGGFEPEVRAIAVASGGVYAGGSFATIGAQPRANLAALDPVSGLATGWAPNPNSSVYAIVPSDGTVYAGGRFTNIGGALRGYIAAIDATSGNATSWNANASGQIIDAIALDGNVVYVGGFFSGIGGHGRLNLAALDATTGMVTAWNPHSIRAVEALAVNASGVCAAGQISLIGGSVRGNLAAIDLTTGAATSWNPGADAGVHALALDGSTVYAGGSFTSIGGIARSRIAAIDASTGIATSWNPGADQAVYALAPDDDVVYAGGTFSSLGGEARNRIGALDADTGPATDWNPNPGPAGTPVLDILVDGGTVYVSGLLSSIGGQPRSNIAAIDASTGLATDWNPAANQTVQAIERSGSILYAGGEFSFIGGATRNRLAAVDLVNGQATGWNPNANGAVNDLVAAADRVYVGGSFTTIGGQPRGALASIDAATGQPLPWNLGPPDTYAHVIGPVSTIARGPSSFLVGAAGVSFLPRTHFFAFQDPTLVDVPGGPRAGLELSLRVLRPNPMRASSVMSFDLPRAGRVTLEVMDPQGRRVRQMIEGVEYPAGRHDIRLERGGMSPGLYFLRLHAMNQHVTRRFVLIP